MLSTINANGSSKVVKTLDVADSVKTDTKKAVNESAKEESKAEKIAKKIASGEYSLDMGQTAKALLGF